MIIFFILSCFNTIQPKNAHVEIIDSEIEITFIQE